MFTLGDQRQHLRGGLREALRKAHLAPTRNGLANHLQRRGVVGTINAGLNRNPLVRLTDRHHHGHTGFGLGEEVRGTLVHVCARVGFVARPLTDLVPIVYVESPFLQLRDDDPVHHVGHGEVSHRRRGAFRNQNVRGQSGLKQQEEQAHGILRA